MNLDLLGFIVSSIGGLAFFVTEWVWPYEEHHPFRDFTLNTLAAVSMLLTTAITMTVLTFGLQRYAPSVALLESWPAALRITLFVLVGDACRYATHRLMHRPAWWRIHRFHHSVEVVNWFSGMRASPLHAVLFTAPLPVLAWLLHIDPLTQTINLVAMALTNHLMHTNTRLPDSVQRALEWVLVTPRFHRAHHSVDPASRDTNFSAMFSFWDRIFGTSFDPDRLRGVPMTYGLDEPGPKRWPNIAIGL